MMFEFVIFTFGQSVHRYQTSPNKTLYFSPSLMHMILKTDKENSIWICLNMNVKLSRAFLKMNLRTSYYMPEFRLNSMGTSLSTKSPCEYLMDSNWKLIISVESSMCLIETFQQHCYVMVPVSYRMRKVSKTNYISVILANPIIINVRFISKDFMPDTTIINEMKRPLKSKHGNLDIARFL